MGMTGPAHRVDNLWRWCYGNNRDLGYMGVPVLGHAGGRIAITPLGNRRPTKAGSYPYLLRAYGREALRELPPV